MSEDLVVGFPSIENAKHNFKAQEFPGKNSKKTEALIMFDIVMFILLMKETSDEQDALRDSFVFRQP